MVKKTSLAAGASVILAILPGGCGRDRPRTFTETEILQRCWGAEQSARTASFDVALDATIVRDGWLTSASRACPDYELRLVAGNPAVDNVLSEVTEPGPFDDRAVHGAVIIGSIRPTYRISDHMILVSVDDLSDFRTMSRTQAERILRRE
jgi:hypothetical protein